MASCLLDLVAKTKNIDISEAMEIAMKELISGSGKGIVSFV
jgi:hypothetical protein